MNWSKGTKSIAIARHHRVLCSSVSAGFVAPTITPQIVFNRYDLLLSIGRNLAMRTASRTMIKALAAGRAPLLKHLVDNTNAPFRLSSKLADLGDAALAYLSHDIGVGVAGLHMEAMGYVWRANGKEILPSGERFPDYVWDTGVANGGVVLSEAKGATSVRSSFGTVDIRARDGIFDQVIPRIGKTTIQGDDILAGYAFGVFAAGGQDAKTAAYETKYYTGATPSDPGDRPSAAILQSHFAGIMRLLGLDDKRSSSDLLEGRISFAVFGDDDQKFVVPEQDVHGRPRPLRFDNSIYFALSLDVAVRALRMRFAFGDEGREKLERWPRFPARPEVLPRGVLALAPDGLALVSRFARRGPSLGWDPGRNFFPLDRTKGAS